MQLQDFARAWNYIFRVIQQNATDPSAEVSLAATVTFHVCALTLNMDGYVHVVYAAGNIEKRAQ